MLYDLIIIGGGPAGITAGIYAARKRLRTLLLTKDFLGQAVETNRIDNYPGFLGISGTALMKKFKEHLENFEITVKEGVEAFQIKKNNAGFSVKTEEGDEFLAKALIIATGRDPRPLEVPGEKEFIGKGVSYCPICDAPVFDGKSVAIIGGGNSGFEAAIDLAKYAKRVFIFEKEDKMMADEILQEEVSKEPKIQLYPQVQIKKIEGTRKVQDIVYQNIKTKKTFQVPMDGVFIQIGSMPATGFLEGICQFNSADEVKVNFETCATSCPGIFAAGDINSGKWKQIIIAAAEGARAALAAYEYIKFGDRTGKRKIKNESR